MKRDQSLNTTANETTKDLYFEETLQYENKTGIVCEKGNLVFFKMKRFFPIR